MSDIWAVVITRPACEDIAEKRLREAGFRVYLPRVRVVLAGHRTPRGRGEVVLRPMLPRYLFAELHPDQWIYPGPGDKWRHWRTPWHNQRAFVSVAAIDVLRESEAQEGEDAVAAATRRSTIDSTVTAEVWGARIEGVVRELRGSDRLIIETLAGRMIEIGERDLVMARK